MPQTHPALTRAPAPGRREALVWLGSGLLAGCGGGGGGAVPAPAPGPAVHYEPLAATPDWTAASHGRLGRSAITANLPVIFDTTRVQSIRLVIHPDNWQVMQADLAALEAQAATAPDMDLLPDPVTVPCEVFAGGRQWYRVGVRFKGKASLYRAGGVDKLPFKLKFNEYEDRFPLIDGQRFFGFKELHLKNNFHDPAQMREILVSDLMRGFGLACSHAAPWRLDVDTGDGAGPRYFGLYTLVEDVEDTVLRTQTADDSGNLYKPEGAAASFAGGTWNTERLGLKTNEDGATYADVAALFARINDRTGLAADASAWRAALEAVFDVPRFLKWLAVNTVIQNWDSYGVATHNYYLYGNPGRAGILEWIPWDHNEALSAHPRCLALGMGSVSVTWPLIRSLMDLPDGVALYKASVLDFATNHFTPAAMDSTIDALAALLAPASDAELANYSFTSPALFASNIATLKTHVATRQAAALAYGS